MSRNNNGYNSYVYIPLILTFAFLLGCFAVALMTVRDDELNSGYTVAKVSNSDVSSNSNKYSYVEKEEDGIRYYVLSMPDLENLSSEVSSEPEPSSEPVESEVKPNSKKKVAYLTFDDGPSENTIKILNILDEYNVKATFFVIYHKGMEKQYKEIASRGHTIALHSYTHNYKKIYSSEDAYFNDLKKIGNYVKSVTGTETKITRFPGGSSNTVSNKYHKGIMKNLKKDVLEQGYIYHDWNVDSGDARSNNVPVETLLKNIKSTLPKQRQANILMHDTGKAKQTTVEALPQIIEYVQSQGFEIQPITEDSTPIRHNW
ncbi:MAG: polysaccharide deacetylase family protein [Acutalibacteraceae bacterium]